MSDEHFYKIAREWTHDAGDEEKPHIVAVHRDTEHHHAHVLVADDKMSKSDISERKELSEQVIGEIEQSLDHHRDQQQQQQEHQQEPARNQASQQDQQQDQGLEL